MPTYFDPYPIPSPPLTVTVLQISPDRARLNSPVTLVQWASEEGGEGGGGENGAALSSAKTYRDSHPSHPCVVEYSTARTRNLSAGGGVGKEQEERGTRRIRCRRVVVTVSLGVLKVTSFCVISCRVDQINMLQISDCWLGTYGSCCLSAVGWRYR